MTRCALTRTLAGLVLPCLVLAACATADRNLAKRTPAEARQAMEAGDARKALDAFKEGVKANPHDKALAADYRSVVENIKRTADLAYGRGDIARASDTYHLLLDRYVDFGTLPGKLSFDKPSLETALKNCRAALVDAQARQALRQGNFAKAIKLRQDAVKDNPQDASLAAKYRETINGIKALADKALREKDFARAGAANALLLGSFASFESIRPAVAFTKSTLMDAVSICRESLTGKGLLVYRKGNLTEAISVWESLLAFDPDNIEIRKAVTTAKTQLDALKKKK